MLNFLSTFKWPFQGSRRTYFSPVKKFARQLVYGKIIVRAGEDARFEVAVGNSADGKKAGTKKASCPALDVFTTIKSYCDLLRCKSKL